MFRCDPMAFCDMFLQPEAAFETMSRLGDMACVEFLDLNTEVAPYLKSYIGEVCRIAEIERKLRYIESEMIKDNISIPDLTTEPKPLLPNEINSLETLIEKWETDIIDMSENQFNLKQDLLEMKEMRYVLRKIGPMLGDAPEGMESILAGRTTDVVLGGRLYVMTGVVKRTRSFPFQMMLWRISRGNVYYREAELDEVLEDPYAGGEIRKVAFLVLCQGEMLYTRMQKILSGFRVNTYPCPESAEERVEMLFKIETRIVDLEDVHMKARYYRCKSLRVISKQWRTCMVQLRKSKAIYHNMNLFTVDITKNYLIAQCWLPEHELKRVQDTLANCSELVETKAQSFISKTETESEPPTCQRTNKFSEAFQMLINTYGDAKYMEVNPGLFTIITFPFLFAVMFGDSGHAVIIIALALWMIIMEKEFMGQRGSEIWNIFFGAGKGETKYKETEGLGLSSVGVIPPHRPPLFHKWIRFLYFLYIFFFTSFFGAALRTGRYVMLLLGLYSLYTGFVYNELFSKSINLSSSMWRNTYNKTALFLNPQIQLGGSNRIERTYRFGMDPIWEISKNKIMTENSIKMKMSLIVGVTHMLFGIVLSIFNYVQFKRYYSILLEFIPEIVFLICIFFWLVILIFYKWLYFYDSHRDVRYGSSCASPILILFIDMVLYSKTSKKPPEEGCEFYMFEGQQSVQSALVTIALCMVPILLFGTPLFIHYNNKSKRKQIMAEISKFRKYRRKSSEVAEERLNAKLALYSTPFADLMIHQGVSTIEFVLSTISHTASYLRLWALSLAHSQLSEMLWKMILSKLGLRVHDKSGVGQLFVIFPIWAFFTVAILVVMEGLSSFLHTLRLHWVEFMSKFYIGGGYPFRPFSFKSILSADADKAEGACSSKNTRREHFGTKSNGLNEV